ncbi:hypothetical protein Vadar_021014 [Vaccinium darrowii]|uniref:Uncharacterized protein n=1 Tax=Vaccinium darrowii TaxID=229202 RepID=A0ACB7Y0Z7_9ERIC|nr:hypothetical protein Vadar_021014 [Vaccinium darrowii]
MSTDGKLFLKPGSLARDKRRYLKIRKDLIKSNSEKFDALGLNKWANPFSHSAQRMNNVTSTKGKRTDDDDSDYEPSDGEDGMSSDGEDDECSGDQSLSFCGRFPVELDVGPLQCQSASQMASTQKRRWLPAGRMTDVLEPQLTSSEPRARPPPPCINNQENLQPNQVMQMASTQKHARLPVGRMTDVFEPRLTSSEPRPQPPPSCINNQPHLQLKPQVQAKRAQFPIAPMSTILQHLPTASEVQERHQSPPSNHGFHSPSDEAPELGQRKGKGRGPARPNAKWGTGEKLVIELNDVDIPIGNTASPLQSQLGILARNGNLAPLTFTDWRARELRPYKERLWAEVKANVDTSDVFKHNCLRSVGKKWRDWKDELKKDFYDIYDNDEDRLANCPDRVDVDQWSILVKFWGTKSAKRRLDEGASQIPPDSLERAALREELFTEVLKPDRNGWLHTYGLGPCRSQVFGTRYTRSQDQRIKDQLRAEVRQEVLAEVGGEIDLLKREYARMAAHMAVIGHPLPLSPNGNGDGDGDRDVGGDHTQSMSEHN